MILAQQAVREILIEARRRNLTYAQTRALLGLPPDK